MMLLKQLLNMKKTSSFSRRGLQENSQLRQELLLEGLGMALKTFLRDEVAASKGV